MTLLIFDKMSEATDAEILRLLPLVSPQRREQALRFKHTFGRFACLKSYLMLQQLIPDDAPLTFSYNEYGKPYLTDHPDLHFNISHCPHAIAVAVDTHPVGIDIERFHTPDDALLRKTMNADEIHLITSSSNPDETFTRLWTQKEALLKFRGTGIIDEIQDLLTTNTAPIHTHSNPALRYVWSVCGLTSPHFL